jgi:hypothetical protein
MAKIEFYIGHSPKFLAVLDDGAVPRKGEFVNIQKTTYTVDRVTWAVDDTDLRARLRACVELTPAIA